MFDLNPAVDHLMLDRELPDPFDRDAPIRRPARGQTYGDGATTATTATPTTAIPSSLDRARHALGTRLIAIGSALTVDEPAARRTA